MGFRDQSGQNLFDMYLRDLKKYPVLTHEEHVELFKKMEEGDKEAKQKLIRCNLRLVISVARAYYRRNVGRFEDLVQEGNIGLMRAVDKFDWKKGFRFSTYAIWWIKQAIGQHASRDRRLVRMPAHIVGLCKRMKQMKDESEGELTIDEISVGVRATKRLVKAAMEASGTVLSLNTEGPYRAGANGVEEKSRLIDYIADESAGADVFGKTSEAQLLRVVRDVLEKELTPREAIVLRLRYGIVDDPGDHEHYPITEENLKTVEGEEEE